METIPKHPTSILKGARTVGIFLMCCALLLVPASSMITGCGRVEFTPIQPPPVQDTTSPEVLSVTPAKDATDISNSITPTVTFNEPMDASSVNASTFTLMDEDHSVVNAEVTCDGITAVLAPSAELNSGTVYTVTVTGSVKDLAGNPMISYFSWSFTTGGMMHGFDPYISIPVGSWPEAVAIGDVNNDGRNDVVMTTSYYYDPDNDYRVFVFIQNSSGLLELSDKYLTDGSYTSMPETIDIGDVNGDDLPDIVVGNSGKNIEVFIQKPSGGFEPSAKYATEDSNKIRIADLNGDGLNDVAGVGWGTDTTSLLLQNAGGTLNSPVSYSVNHGGRDDLDAGDVNDDGLTDLIVMSGQLYSNDNIGVLIQNSDGSLDPVAYYDNGGNEFPRGVATGDMNGDTLNDVVITYWGNSIGVFHQNGSGTLESAESSSTSGGPSAVEIADIDANGLNDIVAIHENYASVGVYYQQPDGSFMDVKLFGLPSASSYNSNRLSVGDINSDGLNDIVVVNFDKGLVVLYHR